MPAGPEPVRERAGLQAADIPPELLASTEPVLLRGLVAPWPAVQAGRASPAAAIAQLRRFYRDATVGARFGPPEIDGRFFYNDELSGFK